MPEEPADQELIERAIGGDRDAFGKIYVRYSARVYQTVYRLMGERNDAADATQEVFVHAHDKLAQFQGRGSFASWLLRIAVNLTLDRMRRRRPRPQDLREDEIEDAAPRRSVPEQHEFEKAVWQVLSGLSIKLRAILVLRYVDGLAYDEIAAVLGCSMGTVKSRLARAHEAVGPGLREIALRRRNGAL